jgi:hypothetical protein
MALGTVYYALVDGARILSGTGVVIAVIVSSQWSRAEEGIITVITLSIYLPGLYSERYRISTLNGVWCS